MRRPMKGVQRQELEQGIACVGRSEQAGLHIKLTNGGRVVSARPKASGCDSHRRTASSVNKEEGPGSHDHPALLAQKPGPPGCLDRRSLMPRLSSRQREAAVTNATVPAAGGRRPSLEKGDAILFGRMSIESANDRSEQPAGTT